MGVGNKKWAWPIKMGVVMTKIFKLASFAYILSSYSPTASLILKLLLIQIAT